MAMDYVVTLRCSTRRRSLSTWPWTMCEGWEGSLGYMWCLTHDPVRHHLAARKPFVVNEAKISLKKGVSVKVACAMAFRRGVPLARLQRQHEARPLGQEHGQQWFPGGRAHLGEVLRPERPVVLTVYCAFSEADAQSTNRTSMVATSLFDVEFIPLKATVTASIEGPLRRKASVLAHRVAVESTE